MIKAVIFDLDGTLCDTLNDIRTGVNAVLERLGYKPRTRSEIHKFINNGARELVRRSLPADVQGVDFIVESALSARTGNRPVSALARELAASRGNAELMNAAKHLNKCIEYALSNVSPAAVSNYLLWAIRGHYN